MARDAIALFLDVPSDSFDVSIEPVLPRDLQRKVGRARKVRDEAEVYSVKRQTPAPRLQPISFKPLT